MKKEKILQQVKYYENEIEELSKEFELNTDIKTRQIIVDKMMISLNKMMKLNKKYNRKNIFKIIRNRLSLS